MKKWMVRIAILLLLLLVVFGVRTWREMRAMGFLREPVYETERPELPALTKPAMLVFSKTNGFIHKEAIPVAKEMLKKIADEAGMAIYFTDSGAVHNAGDLSTFDLIVWNNVSGDVLTVGQRAALKQYLETGGGFVGLHASGGDFEYDWKWYPESLIKAQFIGHPTDPQFQTATIRIDDPQDPIVAHLGESWVREDEWYSFERSPRKAGVHVLATLDESTYEPKFMVKSIRMGDDHPIIWKHCLGNGRVFYSALGHTAETYREPEYIELVARAVGWAAGSEGSQCRNGSETGGEPDGRE